MLTHGELSRFVGGDVALAGAVYGSDHAVLESAAHQAAELIVTPEAAASVLRTLLEHPEMSDDVRRWAVFVRFGETWKTKRPIQQINIAYRKDCEDPIAKVVARLSEIGDAIDGVIEPDEARDLLAQIDECL